ncbi:hypothetical protein BGZ99_007430 [Dissophora globulifera]|uniref:Uncharacterized protein n=1 Tax=Dissophora globulifera TaxID=979702 RepID=A0A9P6RC56_9FUNG|nr:hypothetical protein BGZ99_007430 [Dissophora globulifera]
MRLDRYWIDFTQVEDIGYARKKQRAQHSAIDDIATSDVLNGHQQAFIAICNNVRHRQDLPEWPPSRISRLVSSPQAGMDQIGRLKESIAWVESTLRSRTSGWRSCVKLKVQFFSVFAEQGVNESFADIICECDLHWELCSALYKCVRRHRADPTRMPFETLQRGCELLLSVFSKKERMQCQLRDHLYIMSRSIFKSAAEPLFGSWALWRIDIDVQLTATLNQLVATTTLTVPRNTLESLTKISLIAPYRVVAKIVRTACENRGQCAILLQVLVSLGQLPWLRSSATEPSLLVTVLSDMLNDTDRVHTKSFDQHRYRNFSEFTQRAMTKRSPSGNLVMEPVEFLQECVVPMIDRLITQRAESSASTAFFSSIVNTLMGLYGSASGGESSLHHEWLFHGIHFRVLLRLLRLRTMESSWTADSVATHLGRHWGTRTRRKRRDDGKHAEDISRLCDQIVSQVALQQYIQSILAGTVPGCKDFGDLLDSVAQDSVQLNLESKLLVVPMLQVYRDCIPGKESGFPTLPLSMWPLCRDSLKLFDYQGVLEFEEETLMMQNQGLLRALVFVMDTGRMCDEAMDDIVQAIKQTREDLVDAQLYLSNILVPVLYRVLSLSSRSEGHRLLSKGIPAMMRLWGMADPEFFWDVVGDDVAIGSGLRSLGPYWRAFYRGEYRAGQKDTSEIQAAYTEEVTAQDTLLSVLRTSEMLLRFALEPLPQRNTETVLEVYRMDIGYDVQVDQLTSLVLSSIRLLRIDWPTVDLDVVLYSFMALSRMSSIVADQHKQRMFSNRLDLHASAGSGMGDDDDLATWMSEYCYTMQDDVNPAMEQKQNLARSRAKDELVLAAMNLSEEVVKRQDAYYDAEKADINLEEAMAMNRLRPGTSSGRASSSASDAMDKGTQAWRNSIMAPAAQRATDAKTDLDVEMTDPDEHAVRTEPSTAATTSPERVSRPTMLSADQSECLVIALAYLPAQEQQAVQSRLARLLYKS